MKKNIIKLNESQLRKIITESIKKILLEHKTYYYVFKCNDFDDAEYIQNIAGYDPTFSTNDYCIADEKLETHEIEILTKEKFNELTNNFNFSLLTNYPISYYAINNDYDILFAYSEKEDIHYFFEQK